MRPSLKIPTVFNTDAEPRSRAAQVRARIKAMLAMGCDDSAIARRMGAEFNDVTVFATEEHITLSWMDKRERRSSRINRRGHQS